MIVPSPNQRPKTTNSRRKLYTAFAVLLIAMITVGVVIPFSLPKLVSLFGSQNTCSAGATAPTAQTRFTIILSDQGFNKSKTLAPCPILTVARGQIITIRVTNNDVETHGFIITDYLASGIRLHPSQSQEITFTADQPGNFGIYCNIACSIHGFLQKGRLTVTG